MKNKILSAIMVTGVLSIVSINASVVFAQDAMAKESMATEMSTKANLGKIYTGRFSNLAVQGYDPVAYFTQGQPVKGSKDHTLTLQGAEWRFSSAENMQKFKANPAKFAPQYGGHCAWAMAQGYTAKGDARHWKIVNGKLYLNYNKKIQKDWEVDIPGFIASAAKNWPKYL